MATRRDRNAQGLTAVRVVGALLPPEFLQSIGRLKAKHQNGVDYGLSKSLALKDELARYWRIANDLYTGYAERRNRAGLDRTNVGVQQWLAPLIKTIFGYEDLAAAHPIALADRSFRITHVALDKAVPIVLTVREVDLDRPDPQFGEEGRRRAAHGMMQDLLNADDTRLWGLISNGLKLRLLRDNPTLTRPSFIEADLDRIFDEQLYADFAVLWLTLHASRLRRVNGKQEGCVLEQWRTQASEIGQRALEHLRDGVTTALRALGSGFVQCPQNEMLRTKLSNGQLTTVQFFQQLLRLIYRLLFLLAVEERHLLHNPEATDEQRHLYSDGYAIARLRERALRRRHYDRYTDLWQGLQIVVPRLRHRHVFTRTTCAGRLVFDRPMSRSGRRNDL